jgi:hypothetical protein
MGKFTPGQAAEIMAEAHGHIARWRAENRQHDGGAKFITKTIRNARVPAPAPAPAPDDVDGIDAASAAFLKLRVKRTAICKGIVREGFRKRDREIEALRRQVCALHDEVELRLKLADELAAARAEIAKLRQRAPNYEAELASLRETTEKQAKQIVRLRGQMCQVDYAQRQLETAQRKDRYEATLTVTQLSAVGSATREVLDRLRAEGVDFEQWVPLGPAS